MFCSREYELTSKLDQQNEKSTSNKNDDEESDDELQEEQAALDHKQELTGDALPSVVQIENLEN